MFVRVGRGLASGIGVRSLRRDRPTFAVVPRSESAPTRPVEPSRTRGSSFLVLHVSGQSKALPIRGVHDVAQADAVERLPRCAGWIRGALQLRGSRVPVVDLAVRLGQPPTRLGESTCVVVADVEAAGRQVRVGLLADEDSRVTSARLPRWAVLSVDDLLDPEELRVASDPGPDEARVPACRPVSSIGSVSVVSRRAIEPVPEPLTAHA